MANSIATLSRRLSRSLLYNSRISQLSMRFSTGNLSSNEDYESEDSAIDSVPTSTPPSSPATPPASEGSSENRTFYNVPLENGLDVGIYKAILVGQVGQNPYQKRLKSGRTVTMFSMGTGGIRNNRRPLQTEKPSDYANRSTIQWHRVAIYPEKLGNLLMKNVVQGSILYLEGNLETKVFSDPVSGLVRRIREIAVRSNGRVLFLGGGDDNDQQASKNNTRNVGYY